jgi:hypothetical protein
MASLDRNLRRTLENGVKKARRSAEAGARQAIEQLAVGHHEPWPALTPDQRRLRNRLRAHGRQLGDRLDERKGTQAIERLVSECAYEHWHRLLFARFLAENDLLVEPESAMPVSLDECRELARERGVDWLVLASNFAQRMLPQIFRAGDPVLDVSLSPEKRQELESLLEGLPRDVFIADDSLGWLYQFWQAEQKDGVNRAEKKIGADELAAVTQLFTEDYMVLFLLHNTLGAWWAARVLVKRPELAWCGSESDVRDACAIPGVRWEYLRFVHEGTTGWRPAGTFPDWPSAARDITVLDPCMGSGHFLVLALPMLAAMRAAEEDVLFAESVIAVLRDNLFGLEIDPRCTQIAAFALAFTAWRIVGVRPLPPLQVACSGIAPHATETKWLELAAGDARLEAGMRRMRALFNQAPTLGSLLEPDALAPEGFQAGFSDVRSLLETALSHDRGDVENDELAVAARGIALAATLLVKCFTLVVTNVPYLLRRKQAEELKSFCEATYPDSKNDLATVVLERSEKWLAPGGTLALVTPQAWLYLTTYAKLRQRILRHRRFHLISRLGTGAFDAIGGEVVNVALIALSRCHEIDDAIYAGADVAEEQGIVAKAAALMNCEVTLTKQREHLLAPDCRISDDQAGQVLLERYASTSNGLTTGDLPRMTLRFWELPHRREPWMFLQSSFEATAPFAGLDSLLRWGAGGEDIKALPGGFLRGTDVWGRRGVLVRQTGELQATLYSGAAFEVSTSVLVPKDEEDLPAVWAFCSSPEFNAAVRAIDKSLKVTNATLAKVAFDVEAWRRRARELWPPGLPLAESDDPTLWGFDGRPDHCANPLQVAVARLCGYHWPRQTNDKIPCCAGVSEDGLSSHVRHDGIVPLDALQGEPPAGQRLRALLSDAFRERWSPTTVHDMLRGVGYSGASIEQWLRDSFFEQHCQLFHQRPFIWQIWDGLRYGFNVLVSYHKLAAPGGEGRRTLEKLIYSYLGDWIDRQRADQRTGVEGADGRLAAAQHLKHELEKILAGEPPYDLFARWKPLHDQPVGWEPDLDDGVRVNIRPFMVAKPLHARGKNACILRVPPKIKWDKDRGKEPNRPKGDFPWLWGWDGQSADFLGGAEFDGNRWNNLRYSRAIKLAARERAKGASRDVLPTQKRSVAS